ncbi:MULTISPECIES: YiiX family permuted papain-like enzyme [Sphingobacterium]|uniref:YiiX family permuted papain-like enzyme n=1 Tax=Sphingobacterium TaxID=28453 RepID=UPI001919C607|nr:MULTISPECIES: YiiX family permuted papain-like enzyme [Sphingobacterium]QQT25590.1 YiiX family permuted papain-like enzyme [Sphingobacterium spiritivorum]
MKKILPGLYTLLLLTVLLSCIGKSSENHSLSQLRNKVQNTVQTDIREADLIFQSSLSEQSKAIQLATNSPYSHCGIIFKEGEDYVVLEAVQPVQKTPLLEWIARGENNQYVIRRLKNADQILTTAVLNRMKKEGEKLEGRDYDVRFEWTDDKIYCSELIYKIYERAAGIKLGKLQKLKDFDFTNAAVRAELKERYGRHIPLNETVISPAAVFDSELLETITQE